MYLPPRDDEDMIDSIPDFCRMKGISRSHCYNLIRDGQLKMVKMGRRSGIRRRDARAWDAALPEGISGRG